MRNLIFTLYETAYSSYGTPSEIPWETWIEIFAKHEIRGSPTDSDNKAALDCAKDGRAVVFGTIPADKTRAKAHVLAVDALSLDIDDYTQDVINNELLKLSEFEYFAWTTHKHGSVVAAGKPRIRVVLPLAEPIAPADFPSAWEGLNQLLSGINDRKTKDICRLNYLPSTFDPSKAFTYRHPGRWISLADIPDPELRRPQTTVSLSQPHEIEKIQKYLKILPKSDPLKEPVRALLSGEPFALPGNRHQTILELTLWIAARSQGLTDESIERLFGASLAAMAGQPDPPLLAEVITAYRGGVEKQQQFAIELQAVQQAEAQQYQLAQADATGPYSPEELSQIAAYHGWTAEQLRALWIVQRDGCAYFLGGDARYVGPYSRDDLQLAASKFLARAPVRLVEASRTGYRYRPFADVARESGSLADCVVTDLTRQVSTYDPIARVMYEAIRPLRTDLAPTYSPEIDYWLRLLGAEQYSKLLDWMACCSDLKKLLCAIYFDGEAGSGKTLFAYGMGRLWTEGPPANLERVLDEFNDELIRCPLMLADETLPKKYGKSITASLRSMLSVTAQTLSRKYRPTSELRGAVRLVMAANNEFLLNSDGVATSQDLEAIAQRFLYIKPSPDTTEYLEQFDKSIRESWATKGIAEHALWLTQNRQVENEGKRFWVEGDVSQMHRMLMTGSKWNSLVCEWLVRYLLEPQKLINAGLDEFVRIENEELLVNDQGVKDGWKFYHNDSKIEADTAKIGAALRAISRTSRRRQLRVGEKRHRYRVIDVDHLISWADRYNIGDQERIMNALKNNMMVRYPMPYDARRTQETCDY